MLAMISPSWNQYLRIAAALMAIAGCFARLQAHPMPDTEITIMRSAQVIHLLIQVPSPDLKLALSRNQALLGEQASQLAPYFLAHTRLVTLSGKAIPIRIDVIRSHQTRSADVGKYAEVEVAVSARLDIRTPAVLRYDGILHRIANHRVRVRTNAGIPIGVIEYSLAKKQGTSLLLPATR